jgi:integrase
MIYKRGNVYWTKFQHQGRMIYRSSGQTSRTKARQVEARLRSELALGHYGILRRKAVTLAQFITSQIKPRIAAGDQFKWLRSSIPPILEHSIAVRDLADITTEHVADFTNSRSKDGIAVSTVNRELRALRRILRLAVEWKVAEDTPRVRMSGPDAFRERIVTDTEFASYVLYAPPLLADVATILNDTGLRPDELHRLGWEDISFVNGRYGALAVRYGKTAAARRTLPMTPRVRCILEARWLSASKPTAGWIFPARTHTGHITHSSLRKQHLTALRRSKVESFLLYSLRHTFATRIAPHVDAWTLCKIMGWCSLAVAMRYIHPDEDRVLAAFGQKLELCETGDNSGDSTNASLCGADRMLAVSAAVAEV